MANFNPDNLPSPLREMITGEGKRPPEPKPETVTLTVTQFWIGQMNYLANPNFLCLCESCTRARQGELGRLLKEALASAEGKEGGTCKSS